MGRFGQAPGAIDSLVLGCTHYPLVSNVIRDVIGPDVQLLDAGAPVARRTRSLLEQAGLLHSGNTPAVDPLFLSTGDVDILNIAVLRWLGIAAHALDLDSP